MTLRLLTVMMVEDYEDDGKTVTLINPVPGYALDAKGRPGFKASGLPRITSPLKGTLILLMWGGTPGQQYSFLLSLNAAGTDAQTIGRGDFVWGAERHFTYRLRLQGTFSFFRSALYEFRFLVDGEPIGTLPFPITWEDEGTD